MSKREPYSFSKDSGAHAVGINLSKDLNERIITLCNVLEMSRASLLRFLIQRGIGQLEDKLEERVTKMAAQE